MRVGTGLDNCLWLEQLIIFSLSNQGWFQFNDETVTRIDTLVPKVDTAKKGAKNGKDSKKQSALKGRPPKKRRRIDDSDSEVEIIK